MKFPCECDCGCIADAEPEHADEIVLCARCSFGLCEVDDT